MLSQFADLSSTVDGRYATDTELKFITDYVESFDLRVQTYLKLQELESILVQEAYIKIRSIDPSLFNKGHSDMSAKWKQDTVRVLRYAAITVLMDDSAVLQERFLLWFYTVMKAFDAQHSCDLTYRVLQAIVRQHLASAQANLVCPILELTRYTLASGRTLSSQYSLR